MGHARSDIVIVAIDMGGTHIDGVLLRENELIKAVKHQVRKDDLFGSIWQCLKELLEMVEKDKISRIHLSTTVSTNAIVEDKISKVGLVLQTGPGLKWDYQNLSSKAHLISGSTDHRGVVVKEVDYKELDKIAEHLRNEGAESLAIVTKFSTRNPNTEKKIKDYFRDDFTEVTLGHSLSGRLNFPRRVQTSWLNAAVAKTFRDFASNMQEALKREKITAPVYILKADGGTVDINTALSKPVETILSGPAASFMGISALFPEEKNDAVLLDIGGTTTDIFFLVDGIPLFEPMGIEIDGHKTLVRAVYSVSVGLGGDSQLIIENKQIKIGPRRLGSALAFGGSELTPTDALVFLGQMEGQYPERVSEKLSVFADKLGLDSQECANRIVKQFCQTIMQTVEELLQDINSKPVYTIEELLHGKIVNPQSIKVIGGPAQALAPYLEKASSKRVQFPENYEIANALGAALAKPTREISLYANTDRGILSIPELDIYQKIDDSFDLAQAEELALSHVEKSASQMGLPTDQIESEIVESSSFNMVRGYLGRAKNIRVRAQIKPGLLYQMKQISSEEG